MTNKYICNAILHNYNLHKMEDLLKEYGFRKSTLPNEFTKGKKYKAIVWKTNKVTISRYTPNYGRYLDTTTFENKSDLEKYLKNNHN